MTQVRIAQRLWQATSFRSRALSQSTCRTTTTPRGGVKHSSGRAERCAQSLGVCSSFVPWGSTLLSLPTHMRVSNLFYYVWLSLGGSLVGVQRNKGSPKQTTEFGGSSRRPQHSARKQRKKELEEHHSPLTAGGHSLPKFSWEWIFPGMLNSVAQIEGEPCGARTKNGPKLRKPQIAILFNAHCFSEKIALASMSVVF